MSVLSKKLIHWRVQACRLAKVHKYLTQLSSQGRIEMANATLRLRFNQSRPSILPTFNLEHFQSVLPFHCQAAFLAVTTELGSDCREMPLNITEEEKSETESETESSVDAAAATVSGPNGNFTQKG